MSDQDTPATAEEPARADAAAVEPATTHDTTPRASASTAAADDAAPTLPTIRDHVERLNLARWQVAAVVARLHGSREEDANPVDLNTRMSDSDFDAALDVALHGR